MNDTIPAGSWRAPLVPPHHVDSVGPCPCECNRGGFCGGCGHAGCGGRRARSERPFTIHDLAHSIKAVELYLDMKMEAHAVLRRTCRELGREATVDMLRQAHVRDAALLVSEAHSGWGEA